MSPIGTKPTSPGRGRVSASRGRHGADWLSRPSLTRSGHELIRIPSKLWVPLSYDHVVSNDETRQIFSNYQRALIGAPGP